MALGPGCLQRGVAWPLGSRARRAAVARGARLLRAPRTTPSQKNREPPAAALFGAPPPTSQTSGLVKEDGSPSDCTAGATAVNSVQRASLPSSSLSSAEACLPPCRAPLGLCPQASLPAPSCLPSGPFLKSWGAFQAGAASLCVSSSWRARSCNKCVCR